MLFNSLDFAVFLPLVFAIYWLISGRRVRAQNLFLVLASYFFYAWWDWRYLGLLIGSSLVDYSVGIALSRTDGQFRKRILLSLSLAVNLGVLFLFKYFDFFIGSFVGAFRFFGGGFSTDPLSLILPVGISFYTFQTLSYTIDVYRGRIAPTTDILSFLAFVSFFPQLVAGPIERAKDLLPQFQRRRHFTYEEGVAGLQQILWGLFKKVVVADNCALIADQVFADYGSYGGSTLLLGLIMFSFQIYGDFSGYSDVALGTARLFGIQLGINFAYPYFSRDIGEFWRRWHISLTTWFKDYVYIPLGGSRRGRVITVRNVFVVFLVSALWHGASFTFIAWGLFHALLFVPSILRGRNRRFLQPVSRDGWWPGPIEIFRITLTFLLVTVGWVFFRSPDISTATGYLSGIFSPDLISVPYVFGLGLRQAVLCLVVVLVMLLLEWWGRDRPYPFSETPKGSPIRAWSICFLLSVTIFLLGRGQQAFIYFQF